MVVLFLLLQFRHVQCFTCVPKNHEKGTLHNTCAPQTHNIADRFPRTVRLVSALDLIGLICTRITDRLNPSRLLVVWYVNRTALSYFYDTPCRPWYLLEGVLEIRSRRVLFKQSARPCREATNSGHTHQSVRSLRHFHYGLVLNCRRAGQPHAQGGCSFDEGSQCASRLVGQPLWGSKHPRAGLVVRLLCRLELSSRWCMVA